MNEILPGYFIRVLAVDSFPDLSFAGILRVMDAVPLSFRFSHQAQILGDIQAADFFKDADLVIFDAMYSLADSVSMKEDWGHSSNVMGVELCQMAGARRLCLFHHEPVNDDERIEGILAETLRYEEITRSAEPLEVRAAYDGLVMDL